MEDDASVHITNRSRAILEEISTDRWGPSLTPILSQHKPLRPLYVGLHQDRHRLKFPEDLKTATEEEDNTYRTRKMNEKLPQKAQFMYLYLPFGQDHISNVA